jgi:prepilin peptidase CpaA
LNLAIEMQLLVCVLTVALLIGLAWFDVAQRRLPNKLVGVVALSYFVMAASVEASPLSIASHVGMALIAFLIGTGLFAAGMMSGGDVKFATAVFLWAGAKFAMPAFMLISFAGLAVVFVTLAAGWLERRVPTGIVATIASQWSSARGVPYGAAIALGAIPVVIARTLVGNTVM